jgi:hypothetical protein
MANNKPPEIKPSLSYSEETGNQEGWNVKDAKILSDSAPRQRVDLDPRKFNTLIEQKGIRVCVYRSMYCPNVKSADGAEHEIDCPLCNGSGYVDSDPIEVKAVIQNQALERLVTEGGDWDGNTVLMTFPTGIELQYYTLVVLKDFTDLYFQRVLRNPSGNTDILKYKACRVNIIMDSSGAKYYQQIDFNLDQNGNIKWLTRKPANNTIYSIHYETHVQFRAVKAVHVSRFTQYKSQDGVQHLKYPEEWMCVKEFLLRNRDINTKQDLNEGPFDNHTNTDGDNA